MNLIVVVDQNWAIGCNGDQLIYIPEDLKRFQALTKGHAIILGRKTLATFPNGKPLKWRRNLVLSTQKGYAVEGAEVYASIEDVLKVATEDTFVIGGESVYRQLLPYCKRAYVTMVHKAFAETDSYMPNLDEDSAWKLVQEEEPVAFEDTFYSYRLYEMLS